MPSPNNSMRSRLVAVGLPFYKEPIVRRQALGGLSVLFALLLAVNGMNVVNSYVGRDFMTALAEQQAGLFFAFAGIFSGVFAISTVVEVLALYAEQWLGLLWREWLTGRFLDRYLAERAYLQLAEQSQIDNPDERISLDIKTFTATTLSIFVLIVNGVLTLAAFSWILWSITPWLLLTALGYAAIGSIGTILLGRRLVTLNDQQIRKEADFRYGLGRLREHAQAVAQVAGEEQQRDRLLPRLAKVVENFREVIRVGRNLGFFITSFKYMPQIIPVAVVAPLYMRGAVEFGAVTQAAMAFSQVQGAFALVETQYQELATYAAIIGRLGALREAIESKAASPTPWGPVPRTPLPKRRRQASSIPCASPAAPTGPVVETSPETHRVLYDGLTLWTPEEQRPLIRELSLDAPEGKRIAITGPSEASKVL